MPTARTVFNPSGSVGRVTPFSSGAAVAAAPRSRGSGIQVRNEPAFEPGDVVLQQQLALLQPGELKLVATERCRQMLDGDVEIPVFDTQFGQ